MILSQLIAVWSPSTSAGRTFTAINLAKELSRKSNRVLLVDCDFRNPTISYYLKSVATDDEKKLGIDNIINFAVGKVLDSIVIDFNKLPFENFYYIRGTRNSQRALETDYPSMVHVYEKLRESYEYIVLDINNDVDNAATYAALKNADVIFSILEKNVIKTQMFDKVSRDIFYEFDKRKFVFISNKENGNISMPDCDIVDYMNIDQIHVKLPLLDNELLNAINQGKFGEYMDINKKLQKEYNSGILKLITSYINDDFGNLRNIKRRSTVLNKLFGRVG